MTAIVIDSIAIRQDSEGRFCLNDLHKAAGGERRHEPNLWLTNQTTRELIQELTTPNTGIPVIESLRGRYGGTYVCKELVYAYAMWISPQFHLKVIRAIPDREKVKTLEGWPGSEQTRLITPCLQTSALSTYVPDTYSYQGWVQP
ncbi:KilA-N domain-containing protein [Comamonas kerstersii]|uniref:KilA-N domain-containing protein n=1 Tax=Comamonas kerstersii TaxID=225992 RepID=UPI0026DDA3E2|nr:KilA-N domain-containing protein [Comamonas kerstersii]